MNHLRIDRRHKPDLLQRSFLWLALICWGLFLVALLAFNYARPEIEYGLVRYWNITFRSSWESQMLRVFLFALWGCCGVTLISVILNFPRNRRLDDYHLFYFVPLLLIVLASLITYYVRYL